MDQGKQNKSQHALGDQDRNMEERKNPSWWEGLKLTELIKDKGSEDEMTPVIITTLPNLPEETWMTSNILKTLQTSWKITLNIPESSRNSCRLPKSLRNVLDPIQ